MNQALLRDQSNKAWHIEIMLWVAVVWARHRSSFRRR